MRFPKVPESEYTEEQRKVAGEIVSGPRGELRGPFVPLINSPGLAANIQRLGEFVRFGSDIPDGPLEIAVLMTARKLDCANIWESHSRLASKAGVSRDTMAAIAARKAPPGLKDADADVHGFVAELLAANKVGDAAFERVVARWGRKGAMELAGAVGYYSMLAMVLNVAERPLEPGSVPFGV